MTARPDPLVPAEVDLRDFDGFMLNVERLLASELVALSTGDEFKAAVLLWSRAWKQMPAGSLPNDDRILASFSGAGPRWKKVREMALRGFVLCSDGRFYHRVLCDDVMRAWASKLERIEENNAEAERKRREREDRSRMFAALKAVGVTPAWNTPTRDLRALVTEHVTPSVTDKSQPVTPPVTRTVTAMTGQDRTGTGQEESPVPSPSPTEKQESKNSHSRAGNGSGNGAHSVTIEDPNERMARFQAKLAAHLGANGWDIVIAATQPTSPEHSRALALCKQASRALGKGWPKNWPIAA